MVDAILARVSGVAPFSQVDEARLRDVLDGARTLALEPGEVLAHAGDVADEVYVVLDGALAVIADGPSSGDDGAHLATLGRGSVAGEIAVLTAGRRSATLRAVHRTEAVALPADRFLELLRSSPELGAQLASEASGRLHEARLARHVGHLFPDLDIEAVAELVGRASWVELSSGDVLFREGEEADAAYVVVSGRLRVIRDDSDGQPEVIAEIGAGELAGEIALLDRSTRNATLVAARTTDLARLDRDVFEELVAAHPTAMLAVARVIVRRIRDDLDAFRRAAADGITVTLVPLGVDRRTVELSDTLTDLLSKYGAAEAVGSARLGRALGSEAIAQARAATPEDLRVRHWLDETEDRQRFLLLAADPEPTPWTRRCIDRADHVLLVADASADPGLTDLERELIATRTLPHQRVSLLLLHPADTERPAATATWLEHRDVDDHFHVRLDHDGDLARLARHLAGRAVTLVLSGGGAKGFAHLGVVLAMDELGIPVDAVAGSSMGAPLAALVAMETPVDDLVPRTAALYRRVLDYTIPVTSMIAARRVARSIREAVEGRDIEDLWLPYFCVSTNLTRSRLATHRRGDLATAIRASLSIPGVMPPVPSGDDLLVDGGVLNNLPVDVARRLNPTGTVIASDVAPPWGPRAKSDYGLSLRGSSVLAKRMLPGAEAPRVPSLMATVMRSLLVAAAEARDRGVRRGLADVHLEFDLRGVGLLDFGATERVAEMGLEQAREQFEAWLQGAAAPI